MATLAIAGPLRASGHRAPGHPERPERIDAAMAGVDDLDLGPQLRAVAVDPVREEDVLRVHEPSLVERVRRLADGGGGDVDPDTYVTGSSWSDALAAAGAVRSVVAELTRDGDAHGLVLARPPGHHATRGRSMGFCLVNSVAITAAALRDEGRRVAVVDWDVHHGNGTQEIFWDDPSVLYASVHQHPLYPGTGRADETGGPGARGLTVNVPLPPGTTGDVVAGAFERVIGPRVAEFAPDWIIVSAGFDGHALDPLAGWELQDGDFGALTSMVLDWSGGRARVLLVLEGGYSTDALRGSVRECARLLVDGGRSDSVSRGGPGSDAVEHARRLQEGVGPLPPR